jgi:hypothetical protein
MTAEVIYQSYNQPIIEPPENQKNFSEGIDDDRIDYDSSESADFD